MIRLLILNRQFDVGGTERQLIELLTHLDKKQFEITVATFYPGGAMRADAKNIEGIRLIDLNKAGQFDLIGFMWRLWSVARDARPDIIHGYLDLANVLALLMGSLIRARVVWAIRSARGDYSIYRWTLRLSMQLQDLLGRLADLIVVNSQAGRAHYLAKGFPPSRIVVIANGFDTARFHPDREARQRVRAEWGIGPQETLIGLVGRPDPMKGHAHFVRAAAMLAHDRPEARFVLVGADTGSYAGEIAALSADLGLQDRLLWVGVRTDMPAIYAALDILTSASLSEGLSNVIGEAMACGVPCVVTDVGDSAELVGPTGVVVAPGKPQALVDGWKTLLQIVDSNRFLSTQARQRIIDTYGVKRLVRETAEALARLVS